MQPQELSLLVKEKASSLGFALCGITGALPRKRTEFFEWWVDQGFGAGMHYLKRQKSRRKSVEEILPGAKSVVVCAMRFPGAPEQKPEDLETRAYGKIARYALHKDYHETILPLLEQLAQSIDSAGGTTGSRAYVDTGALSERAFAAEAGLGWVGKNSLLLNQEEGSWFWLGEVITKAQLAPDSPVADHCGKCRRCVDACPTGAIVEHLRSVDSRKCLSFWNIEQRGNIPQEFHKPMGHWLLGCDICQEVCPWNAHSLKESRKEHGAPPVEYVAIDDLLLLSESEFQHRYKGRAVERAKLAGLRRNARIVKENFSKPLK
ncbi:MAG TPA: tRNA epoxyqueuosine(34) reductase QueG [Bdellovibrionota bacterium]|jgi:epoxyqueuosine reductase